MRRTLGWILFIVGIILLCWWATNHQAKDIQSIVTSEADQLTAQINETTSGAAIESSVSGRDIELSGNVPAGNVDEVKQQYMDLKGRRVVRADNLSSVEAMTPYVFDATKQADAGFSVKGYAPLPGSVNALTSEFADASSLQIDLAAGAPENWDDAVKTGGAALKKLTYGELKIVDQDVSLTGFAPDSSAKAGAEADIGNMPSNFNVTTDIKMPIEGPDFVADFDITKGLMIAGTTTEDGSAERIAENLAAPIVNADLNADNQGSIEPDEARLQHIGTFLPRFDTAKVTVYGEKVDFIGDATTGAMDEAEREAFKAGFADGDAVVINDAMPETDAMRDNILNGQKEIYQDGLWRPYVEKVEVSSASCGEGVLSLMATETITFVTASAELDPSSTGLLDRLADPVQSCLATGELALEIGGHTDSDGDEAANQALSQARAEAVRNALAERGVDVTNVEAVGFGESQPIADNNTPEGKAANRRTTFTWRELN